MKSVNKDMKSLENIKLNETKGAIKIAPLSHAHQYCHSV